MKTFRKALGILMALVMVLPCFALTSSAAPFTPTTSLREYSASSAEYSTSSNNPDIPLTKQKRSL